MSTLQLKLPSSIQRHLHALAAAAGVSVEQFLLSAVTEKLSALQGDLRQRADPHAFLAVLDRVPSRPPLPDDE